MLKLTQTQRCSCIWLLLLIENPYLSGVWLGADLRTDMKNAPVSKKLTTCLKLVRYSRFNKKNIGGRGGDI